MHAVQDLPRGPDLVHEPDPQGVIGVDEVGGVQQQLGGMDAAQTLLNLAVEELVVDGAGFPAHAAQDADGLHGAKLAGRNARGSITFA